MVSPLACSTRQACCASFLLAAANGPGGGVARAGAGPAGVPLRPCLADVPQFKPLSLSLPVGLGHPALRGEPSATCCRVWWLNRFQAARPQPTRNCASRSPEPRRKPPCSGIRTSGGDGLAGQAELSSGFPEQLASSILGGLQASAERLQGRPAEAQEVERERRRGPQPVRRSCSIRWDARSKGGIHLTHGLERL